LGVDRLKGKIRGWMLREKGKPILSKEGRNFWMMTRVGGVGRGNCFGRKKRRTRKEGDGKRIGFNAFRKAKGRVERIMNEAMWRFTPQRGNRG